MFIGTSVEGIVSTQTLEWEHAGVGGMARRVVLLEWKEGPMKRRERKSEQMGRGHTTQGLSNNINSRLGEERYIQGDYYKCKRENCNREDDRSLKASQRLGHKGIAFMERVNEARKSRRGEAG